MSSADADGEANRRPSGSRIVKSRKAILYDLRSVRPPARPSRARAHRTHRRPQPSRAPSPAERLEPCQVGPLVEEQLVTFPCEHDDRSTIVQTLRIRASYRTFLLGCVADEISTTRCCSAGPYVFM